MINTDSKSPQITDDDSRNEALLTELEEPLDSLNESNDFIGESYKKVEKEPPRVINQSDVLAGLHYDRTTEVQREVWIEKIRVA